MPLENALVPDSIPTEGDLSIGQDLNYDPSQSPPDAQPVADYTSHDPSHPEYMQPTDATPPSPKEAKFVKYDDDGSAVFSNGVKYLPNGSIRWEDRDTGTIFEQKNPYVKAVTIGKKKEKPDYEADAAKAAATKYGLVPPSDTASTEEIAAYKQKRDQMMSKPPLHDTVVKQMMDRKISPYDESGQPLGPSDAMAKINQFDKENGILSPAQEKIAQQVAQQLNSSRNPALAGYYKLKPKYDSISENISSKPLGERTGVDDAFLLNAAAGIENVDRAPTQNDYKEMLRAAGFRGNIEVATERLWGLFNNDPKYYQERGTRMLSDAMVQQIQANADRTLKPRKELLLRALAPVRERLKTHGIPESQVIPDGLIDDVAVTDAPKTSPTATPSPTVAPQAAEAEAKKIIATSKDPAELEKAQKVLSIIDSLK